MGLKKISLDQITLGIDPVTRMVTLKQGENVIKMTRDQVNGIKALKEGKYPETNMYTSQIIPRNKFRLQPTGAILAECTDEYNAATILINSRGYKGILSYFDSNRGKISWDRDLKRR